MKELNCVQKDETKPLGFVFWFVRVIAVLARFSFLAPLFKSEKQNDITRTKDGQSRERGSCGLAVSFDPETAPLSFFFPLPKLLSPLRAW